MCGIILLKGNNMEIHYLYERKDFWGHRELVDHSTKFTDMKQYNKAFAALVKDNNAAIHIVCKDKIFVLVWDSLSDYEAGILTFYTSSGNQKDIEKNTPKEINKKLKILLKNMFFSVENQ